MVIKSNHNSRTEAEHGQDNNETLEELKNSMLQHNTKQARDGNETDTKRTNKEKKTEDTFDLFWSDYPKKTGKAAALKAWQHINPPPDTVAAILEALVWQCQQPDWHRDHGQYTPHPSTWLNGRRWEDEKPSEGMTSSTGPRRLKVAL
jgi:hypothetical protein